MIEELRTARWFGGKSRALRDTRVLDRARWTDGSSVRLVAVDYDDAPSDVYVLADDLDDPRVALGILSRFAEDATIQTESAGQLAFRRTHVLASLGKQRFEPVSMMRGEQSNTSIRYGDSLILKLFRRLQFGPNPEVEIGSFLTEKTSFKGTAAVAGTLTYTDPQGREASLAVLQEFVRNRGDAWTTILARVRNVLGGAVFDDSVAAMERLGHTTAELHLALAGGSGDFSAELITTADIATWREAILGEVHRAVTALKACQIDIDATSLLARVDGISALAGSLKARHHGDYHLGQVLEREDGSFVIIDFEGEPAKPLSLRREKRSPLRDVAGMLRSLDYARHAALPGAERADAQRAQQWYISARDAFVGAYLETVYQNPRLLPADFESALAALELEKAAYEVLYELNNRPDWLPIPLAAFTHS